MAHNHSGVGHGQVHRRRTTGLPGWQVWAYVIDWPWPRAVPAYVPRETPERNTTVPDWVIAAGPGVPLQGGSYNREALSWLAARVGSFPALAATFRVAGREPLLAAVRALR